MDFMDGLALNLKMKSRQSPTLYPHTSVYPHSTKVFSYSVEKKNTDSIAVLKLCISGFPFVFVAWHSNMSNI